jgi:hypothetical protein
MMIPLPDCLEEAKPKLLPRARPSRQLIREHRAVFGDSPRADADAWLVGYIRRIAIHEAAHAVAAALMSDVDIEFATLKGDDEFGGKVRLHIRSFQPPPPEALARQCLAGLVAERIAGDDPWIDTNGDGDWEQAEKALGDPVLVEHAWDDAILLLTRPCIWRKTVALADALIRKEQLTGKEVYSIADAKDDHRLIDGLQEARLRMLWTGIMHV